MPSTLELAKQHDAAINEAAGARAAARRRARRKATWPRTSDALGCHPDQIAESIAAAKRHGVNIDFTPDGEAILQSQRHEDEYAGLYGMKQNNGGHGKRMRPIWEREGISPEEAQLD